MYKIVLLIATTPSCSKFIVFLPLFKLACCYCATIALDSDAILKDDENIIQLPESHSLPITERDCNNNFMHYTL